MEIKTLFGVQNSKAALLRVGSCFSANRLALLITCSNLYSHQQCQNLHKPLPCRLLTVLSCRSLCANCWPATCQWSPFSCSGHVSPSRKRCHRDGAGWVTPEASGLTTECPRGRVEGARSHGQAPPCVLVEQRDTGTKGRITLPAPPRTLCACKPRKSRIQIHILAPNEGSVILISPQHCLFITVEKYNIHYTSGRGHRCLNYPTVVNRC